MAAATAALGSMPLPLLMHAAPPAAPLGVLGPSPNSTSTCGVRYKAGETGLESPSAAYALYQEGNATEPPIPAQPARCNPCRLTLQRSEQ